MNMRTTLYFYAPEAEKPSAQSLLRKCAKNLPFDSDKISGFRFEGRVRSMERVSYHVKEEREQSVENPFGETLKYRQIRYDETLIQSFGESKFLEIINPGRRWPECLKVLRQKGLSLTRTVPDFKNLIENMESHYADFEVIAYVTNHFLIRSRTACKVSFSAQGDVRDDAAFFLARRNYELTQISLKFKCGDFHFIGTFFRGGRVVCNLDFSDDDHAELLFNITKSYNITESIS